MGRWEPDSRGRLQEAAPALYARRGFDRHSRARSPLERGRQSAPSSPTSPASEKELFGGSALLPRANRAGWAEAPPEDAPLDAVALDSPPPSHARRVPPGPVRQRHAVIAANPELGSRSCRNLADSAPLAIRPMAR